MNTLEPSLVTGSQRKGKSPVTTVLTYLTVFVIIHAGSHLSLLARHDLAVSDYYLPTALSIILIQWVGPKYVLPVVYLNAVATSYLWGNPVDQWMLWFVFAIPETLYAFLSWFLFRVAYHGKYWLPDINNTSVFMAVGVLIPAIIETLLLQSLLVWTNSQSALTFWNYVKSNLLSEITMSLCITLPALFYLTPYIQRKGYLYQKHPDIPIPTILNRNQITELAGIFASLLVLAFLINFVAYWYIYGFFSLFVAIRYGFGPAISTNFFILLITYVLPKFFVNVGENAVGDYNDVNNILLGANFLFVFAVITGRVISDVKIAELKLVRQNKELKQANEELDRFVYSVSHDLTAPLKSILGLINISRIDDRTSERQNFLDMIEKSVLRLEDFISEVLDYSRNTRTKIMIERIQIKELCLEILENLKQTTDKYVPIEFELAEPEIWQDKTRMKVIMNNLLSNALIFQKNYDGHKPFIKVTSEKQGSDLLIQIEDNGVGIQHEQKDKIFKMFYRGHEQSTGSGLGLYIAREATLKIHGNLWVRSEYGKGSTFVVQVKSLAPDH
jgi:signal transduction histidine kinase